MGLEKNVEIPWTARRTNKSIVEELEELERLSILCEKPIRRYFEHVPRRNQENLEKDIRFDEVPGSRGRGRSPNGWATMTTVIL